MLGDPQVSKLPECIERAERARLFPILAETSKEGRTLSIFLATLGAVRELRTNLLAQIGQKLGSTAKLRTYTEVVFKCAKGEQNLGRPDGLLVLDSWGRRWTALVEAKVGKSEITQEQLERYLELAKQNKMDAVITISNQFSAVPHHHPVRVSSRYKGIELYHFSWMHILTEAELLTVNRDVDDDDQAYMLREFRRFISHESAGVQGFTDMPAAWPEVVTKAKAGGNLQAGQQVKDVAEAWQQESRDLCLVLSRQLQRQVTQRLSRAALASPEARFQEDVESLCNDHRLQIGMDIPDAAGPLNIVVDLRSRTIRVSMNLKAPADRLSSKARLNWLLRQIPEDADENLHIRCYWPGRAPATQFPIAVLREDPAEIEDGKGKMQVTSFEVVWLADLGRRFEQRRNFIDDLERAVPAFYEKVGQRLKPWQAPPPKLKEERAEPEDVTPSAISHGAEVDSLRE